MTRREIITEWPIKSDAEMKRECGPLVPLVVVAFFGCLLAVGVMFGDDRANAYGTAPSCFTSSQTSCLDHAASIAFAKGDE